MMEKLKAFFAQDVVKIVAGGVFVIASGLLGVMAPSPTKDTLMLVWTSVITPLAIYLGITSGGTSGLRSNASQAQTAVLVDKGVVPPKLP
jgi:hypothetical protein